MSVSENSREDRLSVEGARFISVVRLLSIIDAAGKPVPTGAKNVPEGAVKVVEAQLTIHALDFWVRNPDYLAYEMLDLYESTGDEDWLAQAKTVMEADEPDLRRVPMMRYLFGAYEDHSDSMATLTSCDLVAVRLKPRAKTTPMKHSYYLLMRGEEKAQEIAANDVLGWFHRRAKLVAAVAGDRTGSQLKDAQHAVSKYHNAKLKELIPPIRDEVAARIAKISAGAS